MPAAASSAALDLYELVAQDIPGQIPWQLRNVVKTLQYIRWLLCREDLLSLMVGHSDAAGG
jgi:hypothetical protein